MRRVITYVSFFCVACVGETLDVGETDAGARGTGAGGSGGTPGDPPPGPALPEWPLPDDCVSMSDLDVVGTWEGGIRDFSFNTIVPLRVQILGASELGGVCGTLQWGEGPPPEPITDPDKGWPEPQGFNPSPAHLYHGATYTLLDGAVRERNVRFHINSAELWREWCALQTPYLHDGGGYRCMPAYEVLTSAGDNSIPCVLSQAEGPPIEVDGLSCAICRSNICTCNSERCGVTLDYVEPSPSFDLTFESARATGKPLELPVTLGVDPETTDIILNRIE